MNSGIPVKKKPTIEPDPRGVGGARQMPSFCSWDGDTLVLNILGTPGAKHDAIGKAEGNQLRVSVTAVPVAGKATDYMVKFLAKEFEVSPGDIRVVFGRFSVNKQLRIQGPKRLPVVVAKALSVPGCKQNSGEV
jgi:hypothetical protein